MPKRPVFYRILLFLGVGLVCSSCLVGRLVWYNFSDITDHKLFPSRPLPASPTPFRFTEARNQSQTALKKVNLPWLDSLLTHTPTVAFLIIRNDSLLFEKYLKNYTGQSTVASFSMAKSYTGTLIGIALEEGHIRSLDDSITAYLPELASRKGFNQITVRHLLQMTSGIYSSESYILPFSSASRLYYGRHLRSYLSHLKIAYPPGTRFAYASVNTQLLGLILERATHTTVTDYLNEKIWKHLGTEYDATWSIDRKKNGLEKTFCCLNAKARDFAKFGRLHLNYGRWNGQQLVPAAWVRTCIQTDTTAGAAWYYHNQWWHTSKRQNNLLANGFHGQYIYINFSKNLIIVRLGKNPGKNVSWQRVFEQLAARL